MKPAPDYAALVKLVPVLRRLPDATGETALTPEEAAQIRLFGFTTDSGKWKCPPLPPQLTRDNPLLEPLSAGWNERSLVPEIPKSERSCEPRAVSLQGGETHVTKQPPFKPIDVSLGHHNVERPVLPCREDPDAKLVQELLSKMRERVHRAGRPMRRRRWQQLYWRYPARIFNRAFAIMVRERRILLEMR